MSRLEIKFKQVLTTLLALAMLLAMAPILSGSLSYAADNSSTYLELYTDASATETTNEYSMDNLAIYIRANSAEEDEYWPWLGLYEGALTSDTWSPDTNLSMVWAYSDTSYGDQNVAYNGDNAVNLLGNGNSQGFGNEYSLSDLGPGTYTVILFKDYNTYGPIAYKQFTITESAAPTVESSLSTDKTKYTVGESIKVTATSGKNGAWVGIYPYNNQSLDRDLLSWYYVSDANGQEVDVLNDDDIVEDIDKVAGIVGRYKAILFTSGYDIDSDSDGNLLIRSFWIGEYENPTWTINDDHTSMTATFTEKSNPSVAAAVSTSEITTTENEATCTEPANITYSATLTADKIRFLTVDEAPFTGNVIITSGNPLGHAWGDWETVTPATTEAEGLEKRVCSRCQAEEERVIPKLDHVHNPTLVEATAATCETAGNEAYYVCECGKMFSDAEAQNEINAIPTIPAKGHAYGAWVFNGVDNKTHTRICGNNPEHIETAACTFEDTTSGNEVTHTCSICGGSYKSTILSTDKTEYSIGEPIMVTATGTGKDWVGLYKKGDVPGAAGTTSYYYYYVADHNNEPFNVLDGTYQHTLTPGEYTVYLLENDGYNVLGSVDITISHTCSIEIDKTEYTKGDPILVSATSDYPDAWVGLYDYDYSDPLDTTLLSHYKLSDSNGEPVDIWNGDIVEDKDKLEELAAGKYKVILFTSGYDIDVDSQERLMIRSFDLKDNSECNHDWGDWVFNPENKTHTRTCKIDSSHKETKPCTFNDGVPSSDPGEYIYTCTVCGGKYEQVKGPVITTNKKEYELGEDILVTTELNGENGTTSGGWIALYEKGSGPSYDTSLLWYFPAEFDNPKVLQSVLTPSDTNKENMSEEWPESWGDTLPAGEYELVFLKGRKPYTSEYQPTYFSVVRGIESETVTKEPTCTESGIKHVKYKDGAEEDVEIDPLGHDPKEEWTYIAEEKAHYHACSRCDEKLDKAACTFDEGKVTKEPTVKEEGEKTYTCTVCGGTYTEAIPTLVESGVKRVYGSTRYQTAILQANELKALLKVDKFDAVIVATGENFADALSGAYLGYVKKAPILLVNKSSVNEVKEYIKNNLASGGTIYLLGGPAVVPNDVTSGLSGFTSKRLFGKDRYQTNIEILKEAGVSKEEIMICDGKDFADSLSASPAKRPILLVNNSLNKAQRAYLDTLRTRKYYLIGGTGVLPTALENDINTNFGSTIRLGGKDRYDTSVKVAKNKDLFNSPSKAVLAYGRNYPDGLCGGPLAAYMDAPLLLVQDASAATIKGYTSPKGIKSGIVLGGPSLIADKSARSIFGLNETDEIYVVNK